MEAGVDEITLHKAEEAGGGGDVDIGGGAAGGAAPAVNGGGGGGGSKEERIQVSVRLRPLNAKELARNDPSDWECVDDATVVFKNSHVPIAYSFDRVFPCDCNTERVYEEGAKDVALSVVNGINASIFAYGQTSSGKTYTMTGITENAMTDIYDYIQKHHKRDFVLKFSAMEIYNEAVRDLLSADTTPLRLLDDPDRGTIVEKLTEETLRDWEHMKELLSICEAQRQIGETSLNETSSRSHQILRLSVESSANKFLGKDNSSTLTATVNFVDLAGSERASQTLSAGTRLKEGCHINRSLLTLGTVIRKLSKGRTGHIPYRDSKLTRILHHSLGGNARTAIICTMSPARSHVEQSRNTLLFASCAKEVSTSAQVNVIMSDKALVKHLQKELNRLENALRSLGLNSDKSSLTEALLKEKDAQIQKMADEIKELRRQRDLARSRIEDLTRVDGYVHPPVSHASSTYDDEIRSVSDSSSVLDFGLIQSAVFHQFSHYSANGSDGETEFSENSNEYDALLTQNSRINLISVGSANYKEKELLVMKDICKEVQCDETDENEMSATRNKQLCALSTEDNDNVNGVGDQKTTAILHGNQDMHHSGEAVSETCSISEKSSSIVEESENALPSSVSVSELKDQDITISKHEGDSDKEEKEHFDEICSTREEQQSHGKLIDGSEHVLPSLPSTVEDDNLGHQKTKPKDKRENDVDIRNTLKDCVKQCSCDPLSLTSMRAPSSYRGLCLARSRSCNALLMNNVSSSWFMGEYCGSQPPSKNISDLFGRPKVFQRDSYALKYGSRNEGPSDDGSESSGGISPDVVSPNHKKIDPEDDIARISTLVEGLKEIAQTQYQIQLGNEQVMDLNVTENIKFEKSSERAPDEMLSPKQSFNWPAKFEKLQRDIIQLWNTCHVSVVHRTYFFLLFKGDPTDSIYMEVELRRLSFLSRALDAENLDKSMGEKKNNLTQASCMKNLRRERRMLCRQLQKRLSAEERDNLYRKWGVPLDSKQRKSQLIRQLWSDTKNMDHIKESASVVATLIGFLESDQALKEMFGLSFTPQQVHKRSHSWKHGMSSVV